MTLSCCIAEYRRNNLYGIWAIGTVATLDTVIVCRCEDIVRKYSPSALRPKKTALSLVQCTNAEYYSNQGNPNRSSELHINVVFFTKFGMCCIVIRFNWLKRASILVVTYANDFRKKLKHFCIKPEVHFLHKALANNLDHIKPCTVVQLLTTLGPQIVWIPDRIIIGALIREIKVDIFWKFI